MTKILFVTTNVSEIGELKDTGVTLEEFAIPYLIFRATGYDVEVASLLGGLSPVDEKSMSCSNPMEWDDCIKILRATKSIDEVINNEYDCVYFVGGHGAMKDFPYCDKIISLINKMNSENKIIASICHGVSALLGVENLINQKYVTSFTDREEKILKTNETMPFSLQTKLVDCNAYFVEAKPWIAHVERVQNIITGQNNKSSTLIAETIIDAIQFNN